MNLGVNSSFDNEMNQERETGVKPGWRVGAPLARFVLFPVKKETKENDEEKTT